MRFKSRSRALAAAALSATVALAGLTTVAAPAGAAPAETDRVAGQNRYGTAAAAATRAFPGGADVVVLTTGEQIPDALSANPIAGENDAPILLATRNSVPAETQAALAALDPETIIIVGGTSAISAAVETGLEGAGFTVQREAGEDRFETAAEVARAVGEAPAIDADGTGSQTARPTVALANGVTGLADAVSAAPMLHQEEIPLLLTSGDTLNADAAAAIEDLGATQVIILGGTAVIPASVEQALEADGINAERLAGGDRFGTAAAIADFEVDFLGFDAATTFLASGFSLVDALAGGPLASVENGPIVLVSETDVPAPTADWLEDNAADVDEVVAIGGTAVINDGVLDEAADLADEGTVASATIRPELLSAQIVETVTAGNATPTKPAGTYVRYTFDEAVGSSFANVFGNFKVYNSDASVADTGGAAVTEPGGTSVLVRFNAINTPTLAAPLTVATVVQNAVFDAAGNGNTEGAAAIGSAATTTLTAGVTTAPDLVSVSGFRQGATVGTTAVDFVFDEPATVLLTGGFSLVTTSNTVITCTASTTPASTAPSGGTVPGGSGTTTITVVCNNPPVTGDPGGVPLSAANVARGVVDPAAVQDAGGVTNPLQTADVGNSGNSSGPDLVSATFVQGTTTDSAIYVFDEAISGAGAATLFNVYSSNGAQIDSGAAPTVSTTDPRQVLVSFGPTALDSAVGASVDPAAVTALAGGATNQKDEVGVTNTNSTTVQPGSTSAPDLTGVTLVPTNGFTPAMAQYTFDQNVATAPSDTGFILYLADGTRLVSNACARGTTSPTTDSAASSAVVTCTFTATNSQVINAVLGTVLEAAVVAETGGNGNPEGDAITSGGTGTPAS